MIESTCPDPSCSEPTPGPAELSQHILEEHGLSGNMLSYVETLTIISDHSCPICSESKSSSFGLGQHIVMSHIDDKTSDEAEYFLRRLATGLRSGDSHPVSGESWEWTEDMKERHSDVITDALSDPEVRQRMSEAHSDQEMTEEFAEKISQAHERGAYEGSYDISEETAEKISETVKERIESDPEYREKIMENLDEAHENAPSGEDHWNYGGSRPYREEDIHLPEIGITVRSTWEAEVARRFHEVGIPFAYEEMTVEWKEGRTYTPDFSVPPCYVVEVKGHATDESQLKAYETMRRIPDDWQYVVIGDPKELMPCDQRWDIWW